MSAPTTSAPTTPAPTVSASSAPTPSPAPGASTPAAHSAPTRLAFEGIRRRFGRLRVLDGVSGAVEPGGVLLVTGRNGSGKSTLMRILAGLLAADRGRVDYRVDGRDLDLGERRRAVGWVAPDLAFYEELDCRENLELFCRLRGEPRSRADELLEVVGLPPERLAGALSSGMRQRLRFAFALLGRPRLMLLDEPWQNLDAPGVALGRAVLEDHLEGGGLAVVANPGPLEIPRVASRIDLGG